MRLPKTGGTLTAYCVQLIVGTRPEAIKLAPLAHALAAVGLAPRLLLTGQHPALRACDHGLQGVPWELLGCTGRDDPMAHADAVAAAVTPVLQRDPPDMVVVQGDTSSALGGAKAAASLGLPIAHVEAGLRSFDLAMPWPEEGNRIAIDALSDLLFAPTHVSAANLRRESLAGEIHVTGNTGIDAFLGTLATLPPSPRRSAGTEPLKLLVTCHRRENWGSGMTSLGLALIELAREGSAAIDVVTHPNPRIAGAMRLLFDHEPGMTLLAPTCHAGMIERMRAADLILSDSGGVQEEAPALGVPLLVLRERTERPEAIDSGNARLVGTGTATVLTEVRRLVANRSLLKAMAKPALPFGDGKASPRIAAHIRNWLILQERPALMRRRA